MDRHFVTATVIQNQTEGIINIKSKVLPLNLSKRSYITCTKPQMNGALVDERCDPNSFYYRHGHLYHF